MSRRTRISTEFKIYTHPFIKNSNIKAKKHFYPKYILHIHLHRKEVCIFLIKLHISLFFVKFINSYIVSNIMYKSIK